MDTLETNHQIGALRYRIAQLNDLQHQREELFAIAGAGLPRNEILVSQIAKIDSALMGARTALHQILGSFPVEDRARVLRQCGADVTLKRRPAASG
jgi:hypothetical protein